MSPISAPRVIDEARSFLSLNFLPASFFPPVIEKRPAKMGLPPKKFDKSSRAINQGRSCAGTAECVNLAPVNVIHP